MKKAFECERVSYYYCIDCALFICVDFVLDVLGSMPPKIVVELSSDLFDNCSSITVYNKFDLYHHPRIYYFNIHTNKWCDTFKLMSQVIYSLYKDPKQPTNPTPLYYRIYEQQQ